MALSCRFAQAIFQSTLPARGATAFAESANVSVIFQSTLPARGATCTPEREYRDGEISIHAPRTGSDTSAKK